MPSFEMREGPESTKTLDTPAAPAGVSAAEPRKSGAAPTILVGRFDCETDQTFDTLSRGFTRHMIAGLTRFQDLIVLGPDTSSAYASASQQERSEIIKTVDMIVTGSMAIDAERFCVEAMLIDANTDRVIWAETFDRKLQPSSLVAVRDDVANCIARTLAHSYGVILSNRANEVEGAAAEELGLYNCVALYYRYSSSYEARLYEKVRKCLERAIAREPTYAEAFACLSQVYSDAFRFNLGDDAEREELRAKALHLAQRAIALAPCSSRAFHALAVAYWFLNDVPSSLEAYETARALNANATEIMADLGLRYAVLADWEKAVPLLEESYRRNPAQPGTYRMGLWLYHFGHGRYHEALSEGRKVNAPNVIFGFLAEAASLAGLGRKKEAAAAIGHLLEIDPDYGSKIEDDLAGRNVHPALAEKIIQALRAAGLTGTPALQPRRA